MDDVDKPYLLFKPSIILVLFGWITVVLKVMQILKKNG